MGNCINYCCINSWCIIPCLITKNTSSLETYKLKGSFRSKVVEVYDGDTITIILLNKCGFEKHKLRMYGYDSPEMKPKKNVPNRNQEIEKAKIARDKLKELILDKVVIFESKGYDKYGRLLGNIYINNFCNKININEYMIKNSYGYEYFGGTKKKNNITNV